MSDNPVIDGNNNCLDCGSKVCDEIAEELDIGLNFKVSSTAKIEGIYARLDGKPEESNPYPADWVIDDPKKNLMKSMGWKEGWVGQHYVLYIKELEKVVDAAKGLEYQLGVDIEYRVCKDPVTKAMYRSLTRALEVLNKEKGGCND